MEILDGMAPPGEYDPAVHDGIKILPANQYLRLWTAASSKKVTKLKV
jgi:hypothetical protein